MKRLTGHRADWLQFRRMATVENYCDGLAKRVISRGYQVWVYYQTYRSITSIPLDREWNPESDGIECRVSEGNGTRQRWSEEQECSKADAWGEEQHDEVRGLGGS